MLKGITAIQIGAIPKTTIQAIIERQPETAQQTLDDTATEELKQVPSVVSGEMPAPTKKSPKKMRGRKPKVKPADIQTPEIPPTKNGTVADAAQKDDPANPTADALPVSRNKRNRRKTG
ncbi:MAG TPA: hypothetical protein O0X32_03295 [Methanocorpusculum sp.]|nr:hypothetical protein [Methanocorpusculum sp.]